MVSLSEWIRGFVAVLATVAVIIGLVGLGTSLTDPDAVLRSLLAATAGAITLALLLRAERRPNRQPNSTTSTVASTTR
ncbi:hypothetical protein [Microlunatus speluncae]|uniref:hypothetical protein n=1 Tax=Microlunatus speluncae TaxID=2594267 RepID=UPI0012667F4C|nr:hypothetical protein [Microlunatus speluncae]